MLRNWFGKVVRVERTIRGTDLPATEYTLETPIDKSRDYSWKPITKLTHFRNFQYNNLTWEVVAFEVVVSHQTGLSSPCVLLCSDDNVSGCVILAIVMVNDDDNYNYGEIPCDAIPSNGKYYLKDGPNVLWCNSNGLVMLSANDTNKMTLNCFPLERLFSIDNTSGLGWALDRFWVLSGRQEVDSLRVFARANLSVSDDPNLPKKLKSIRPDVLWCTAIITQQEGSPAINKLPDNIYIHSDYAAVINCITDYDNCDPYMLSDPDQLTQYIVGTTYNQMLIFGDGKVLHCISLMCVPFSILVCQVCPVYATITGYRVVLDVTQTL